VRQSSSSSQAGPEAYTSDAPQPRGLLCNPGSPLNLDVPASATRCTTRETPSSERRNSVGENCPVILPQCRLPCRKSATWDRRLYFPSEGRRAEDFFRPLKIRRLRPGLNPRIWVLKASTLTPRPPKPLCASVGY